MNIIQKQPNPSGGYPSPQDWPGPSLPEGFAEIPADFDLTTYYAMQGFVTLTVVDDAVTGMTANQAAKDANDMKYPIVGSTSTVPTHTTEDRLSALESAMDYVLMGGNK